MITRIKISVLKLLSFFTQVWLRLRGLEAGKGCFIDGMPVFRRFKGSRIILRDRVTLISRGRHNALLSEPVNLRTLSPAAVIELKFRVGISGSRIICCSRITVGEYTIIGPGTVIYDYDGHSYSPETGWQSPQNRLRTGRPISIGNKCFIGAHCLILGGVTIGDNCVVAAGSVVTHDIPAGHKASGNPATYEPLPKILGGVGRKKPTKV